MQFRNRSANIQHFSMVPRADIPRSTFDIETTHKTTFDAGFLIPIYVDEILPGDTFKLNMSVFCRMATPIFPVMDNLYLESFFFFVPNRLVWSNWERFMGQQANPADSISFTVPTLSFTGAGYTIGSIGDYFGLPTVGQVNSGNWSHITLPLRGYNLIWNEWFRDQNLQNSVVVRRTDGGDTVADWTLLRRGKRHDYFTSALPFAQKFTAPTVPLGTSAPVVTTGVSPVFTVVGGAPVNSQGRVTAGSPNLQIASNASAALPFAFGNETGLQANLGAAVGSTINALRTSFQIQRLLERDARGGTRYTEIIRSHFGVVSPDARLQRPEYLGGGSTPINVNPIAQTSGTGASGTTAPLGALSAFGTFMANNHGFTQSFTEHGYIIGLVNVRADLTYQQGVRKLWNRQTRYDYYFPVFAHLGEQPIFNREIFINGTGQDSGVFGFQERWAEYRYFPGMITGLFRSTASGTIDGWHLAQRFTVAPTLNATFIQDNPPMQRVLAVGAAANGQQFIFDSLIKIRASRPMPMYSVPGLIDHF